MDSSTGQVKSSWFYSDVYFKERVYRTALRNHRERARLKLEELKKDAREVKTH